MNKKKVAVAVLTTSLFLSIPSLSLAGPFDFMNKEESKKTESKVDVNALSARGTKLILTVNRATSAFSDAAILMLDALGMKVEAEKLKAIKTEVAKKPDDPESVKKLIAGTSNALGELNKVDLTSNKKLKGSQESLIKSSLNFGGGALLDLKAVDDAKKLVQEATGLVDQIKSNPMAGLSALGTVNSIISSGKFIVDNVPNQVKSVQGFSQKLVDYFKANKIEAPSADKMKKFSEGLMKG